MSKIVILNPDHEKELQVLISYGTEDDEKDLVIIKPERSFTFDLNKCVILSIAVDGGLVV